MSDVQATFLTIGWVAIFLIFSEGMATLGKIKKETARKIIHISVGNVIFFIPMFDSRWLAAGIPGLFIFGNYLLSPMSPLKKFQLRTFQAGHKWGTILYPLSLSISVYLFFDRPWLIVATFFPVVYGDGLAAVIGPLAKNGTFTIFGTTKSLIGTAVISLFSFISVTFGIMILGYSLEIAILTGLIVCIISPFVEILSPKGTDNLVLPLVLIGLLSQIGDMILLNSSALDLTQFSYGLIFGLIFAIGGYFLKVLTSDGAITGFLITLMMLGIGGVTIGVELFLFFVLGSGATKLVKNFAGTTQEEFEKGGEQRDSIQAIAKAGIPGVLSIVYLFNSDILVFYVITGIMAASLVDTMATEIGIATKGTPVHVMTPWKMAQPGQTGVISAKGTLGGIGFGSIFAVILYLVNFLDPNITINLPIIYFTIMIVIAGFVGMISDSVIGTTIQRHNKCQQCGKIVEADTHHDQPTILERGIPFINNDVTNILGTTIGGICSYLLYTRIFYSLI